MNKYQFLTGTAEDREEYLRMCFNTMIEILKKRDVTMIGFNLSIYDDNQTIHSFRQGVIDKNLLVETIKNQEKSAKMSRWEKDENQIYSER